MYYAPAVGSQLQSVEGAENNVHTHTILLLSTTHAQITLFVCAHSCNQSKELKMHTHTILLLFATRYTNNVGRMYPRIVRL